MHKKSPLYCVINPSIKLKRRKSHKIYIKFATFNFQHAIQLSKSQYVRIRLV
jgi:hypothetical protein